MFSQFEVKQQRRFDSFDRQASVGRTRVEASQASTQDQRQSYTLDLHLLPNIPHSSLLGHIATSSFFHHYVSEVPSFYRLDLQSLSAIIDSAQSRRMLTEIIIALGILTLPRRSATSVLAARYRYTRALRLTNKALHDPSTAKTDEELLAVILLGLYETTPDESHSALSWNAHLEGARLLLQVQCQERLSRGPAYKTFSAVRLQIVLHCFMTARPVPQDLMDLSNQLGKTQGPEEYFAGQLMSLVARVCALLALDRRGGQDVRNHIIGEAQKVDDALVEWATTILQYDAYALWRAAKMPDSSVLHDTLLLYVSLFSAEVWNLYRSVRVSLNGLLVEQCLSLGRQQPEMQLVEAVDQPNTEWPARSFLQHQRLAIIDGLRDDICDTIPYLMGVRQTRELPLHSRTLIVHTFGFLVQTGSAGDEKTVWATGMLSHMQQNADVGQGAIWMNTSQTREGTQTLVVQTAQVS